MFCLMGLLSCRQVTQRVSILWEMFLLEAELLTFPPVFFLLRGTLLLNSDGHRTLTYLYMLKLVIGGKECF
jgi:hypothetical protein